MRPLRALDLFCSAGGVTKGLQRAGFHVTGVDIVDQPNYCGDMFVRGDALNPEGVYVDAFDFIWASPPCQGYSAMRHAPGARGAPLLIAPVREMLAATGKPWCIENVEDARWAMVDPIMLCGSMFGLGAQGCQLMRHRLFQCSFELPQLPCRHSKAPVIGVYGGHARRRAASAGGRGTKDVWVGGHRCAASEALGIDWMTLTEMSEAIPPVYAEWVGLAARQHILTRRGVA
jgi:DNA (cytosine-5)-methyltransferase 1